VALTAGGAAMRLFEAGKTPLVVPEGYNAIYSM
jgi:hypothetical protein